MVDVLKITHALRGVSRRLAARYYNLIRAIGTGQAYPDIEEEFVRETGTVTLEVLYSALAETLNEVITSTSLDIRSTERSAPDDTQSAAVDLTLDQRLDDLGDALLDMFQETFPGEVDLAETVEIEQEENWDWPEIDDEADLDEDLLAEIEEKAIRELKEIVEKELRSDRPMSESLDRIADRADAKGAEAASLVDADVMRAGRQLINDAGLKDPGRYGWMRVTGARPCAFCSMLASRGAVYDTRESAGYGNLYHKNCHCTQVPVFIKNPYFSARDKFFIDSWTSVTKGYSGKSALKTWRTWLTKEYRSGQVPDQDVFGPAKAAR
jgi:hypothetical protein